MYERFFKRIIDLILSGVGIIFLTPVWVIIAIAIKTDDPGPVFFKQKRIGKDKNGQKQFFNIIKFRTMKMSTPRDIPTHMLENPELHITRVGAFLRKSSMDELPQIFNIFMGQMSIVGPRPALWNQDDLYIERAKYRANTILPGLTGLAQINGRDELDIDVKACYDGRYVEKMSFIFDCNCFWRTVKSVLHHEGVMEGTTGVAQKHEEILNK